MLHYDCMQQAAHAISTRDAHDGRNQWVWSHARSTTKRKILVDQEIKWCFKTGSSNQEQNLAIKNFDHRRRWKYRVHSGDYPLQGIPCSSTPLVEERLNSTTLLIGVNNNIIIL